MSTVGKCVGLLLVIETVDSHICPKRDKSNQKVNYYLLNKAYDYNVNFIVSNAKLNNDIECHITICNILTQI